MAGPVFNFTEEGRCSLAKFVGITHWLCILPSFICLLTALYIQILIQDKISFIENYDGLVLPGFLVFSGFFGFFAHILCGKVAYVNSTPEKREKWSGFMLAAMIATAVIFIAELTSGILCFVHIANLEDSFETGMRVAMSAYKNDATTKEEMDILQLTYECCGSRSYKDWFYITWIHPDYRNMSIVPPMGRGHLELGPNLVTDDVPFSCCSAHVLRPCVNHHVHDNKLHYNYDFRTKNTLHNIGCTDKLMEFYENSVLIVAGSLVLGLSFLQLILVLTFRLLQTSISTAMSSDDKEGPSIGYFFINPQPAEGVDTTLPSEQDTLLETTAESFDQDENDVTEDRYIELNNDYVEPDYETPLSMVEEEPIYDEADVEEYLATKFTQSRERFAHLSEPDYEQADELPPPMEEEPIYENINHSRHIPSLTRVNSNYGSYMKMNLSNSSSPRKIMRREHFYRRHSGKHSPHVHRHPLPSPPHRPGEHGDTIVINMAAQNSPEIVSKPYYEEKNFSQPQQRHTQQRHTQKRPTQQRPAHQQCPTQQRFSQPRPADQQCPTHLHLETSRSKFPKPRPPRRRPPTSHKMYWSPTVSPRKLQTILDNHSIVPEINRSPSKRFSPKRFISRPRTIFKHGVSYDCNHAIE